MPEVVGVKFSLAGKVYYFDPCGLKLEKGRAVLVETSRGVEYGTVAMANKTVDDAAIVKPLKKVVRAANEKDDEIDRENREFEEKALKICEEKVAKYGLDMKLVKAEYTFDHSKLLFYFSADGRVDFRDLVKDLASVFRTRIELRQIGVRDEAMMTGGLGICGYPLCCSTFLEDFQPVSINMAKEQGLSLNPTKISGACGRLMCCLTYENNCYHALSKQAPKVDSVVETPMGRGVVTDIELLKEQCRVHLDDGTDVVVKFSDLGCQRAKHCPRQENETV
jgi:cell fate regulator YaaT (PSP1 superfamily)